MIPGRHLLQLDAVERMAEGANYGQLAEIARSTGNWPLLHVLRALKAEQCTKRKKLKHNPHESTY